MERTVLIFANPIAGRGKGRAIAQRLASRLRSDGLDPRLVFERADRLADADFPHSARAAIAIGGDGTVRSVAWRLFQRYDRHTPPLLVTPLGTANLLGRHLGTHWTDPQLPDRVSDAIRRMKTAHLDAGSCNGELFLLMAGVGLDARIVHELDRLRSGPIDLTSYAVPAALALGFYTYPPLTVTADDQRIWDDRPGVAFVGNVKEYGAGFPILPHARSDDGRLDVCVLPCASRGELIMQFLRAAAGDHIEAEGSVYLKARRVRIESGEPVPVQIDGDAAGHTPIECGLLPVRLPFIVPA